MRDDAKYTMRYKQVLPSRTDELFRIRNVVEREALAFGFDEETAYRLALAVDEACTNIIKHAYMGNAAHSFELEIDTSGDQFVVLLTDWGKHFQPGQRPQLNMRQYFEQMRSGGLGLHIIQLVMDQVDYDIPSGEANRLRMVKFLNSAGRS